MDSLRIRGARQHNLQNVSCDIPRNRLVVITGVSGSGKSSLAFDTIFAEGQRRYVESLSAYARQFLEQMEKPDVDSIEGLSPAISIEQRTTSRNPRSTVGTVTEIYDYLRLLYASVGQPALSRSAAGRSRPRRSRRWWTGPLRLPAGSRFVGAGAVRRPARRASTRSRWPRWSRRGSCAPAWTARWSTSTIRRSSTSRRSTRSRSSWTGSSRRRPTTRSTASVWPTRSRRRRASRAG